MPSHPQIPIPTQTPTLCLRPSPRAHKLAHLHSSLTHPHKHSSRSTALSLTFKSQTGGSPPRPTLAGLQTSTKHTRSPLRDHSCPASSRKHTLAAKQAASPESRSPSNPRGRVLSPELPRVTSTWPPTSLPAHGEHSAPSPAEHTRSPHLSDSARTRGKGDTHRLRVQEGMSRGSAASPRPLQSSESPAQVQAAAQGARGPAWAPADSGQCSSSNSSSQSRRRGARSGAPSTPGPGRAILSGARREAGERGLRGAGGRGRWLRSALGSAPGHGRPAPVGSAAAALSRHALPRPLRSTLRGPPPPRPSGPSPARGELCGVPQ